MRLAYITTVQISDKDAQSLQIRAMAKSFGSILGTDFLLISPKNERNISIKSDYRWEKLKIFQNPRWLRYCFTIVYSFRLVWAFKPEVIYSRDILIVFFYKLLGYNSVYEIHKPFETLIGHILFSIIGIKNKVVAISQSLKVFLTTKYKIIESNIFVAHDGVFFDEFCQNIVTDKERSKIDLFGVNDNKFIILYSGSFQKGKGVELILVAAKEICRINKDIVFVFLGADKNDRNNNLIFIKRVSQSEVIKYLKTADLLVLPNTTDLSYSKYTSPLKLFEYMASGVPFISSRSNSINEILADYPENLFESDQDGALLNKIIDVADNYEKYKASAVKILKLSENFDWHKRAEKILSFINK